MWTSEFTAGRKKGRCCAGEHCNFPNMQLCKEHVCQKCKKIVHMLCGETIAGSDDSVCKKCSAKTPSSENDQVPTKKRGHYGFQKIQPNSPKRK